MARGKRGKSSEGISVDLSRVEVGGKAVPEGLYAVEVSAATLEESKEKNPYIKFEFQVTEGTSKGSKLYTNCSLQSHALFSLKAVLLALGFEVPGKAFDLDLNDLIGLDCEVEVTHETYEGKKKARITEFINPNDGEEGGDDEMEELLGELDIDELKELAKALKVKVSKKADEEKIIELLMDQDEDELQEAYDELFGEEEDEPDEDDDEEEVDYSELSLKELKAECKTRGLKVTRSMDEEDLIELLEEDDEE